MKEASYNCPSCRYDCAPGAKDELTCRQLKHCDYWETKYDDGIRERSKEEKRIELRNSMLLYLLCALGTLAIGLGVSWLTRI